MENTGKGASYRFRQGDFRDLLNSGQTFGSRQELIERMKNRKNIRLLVAALIFSSGATAEAHHDLGSTYAMKETIHIEGEVLQFIYRNPHSFVSLREAGHDERIWILEWASARKFDRQRVQARTIRVGDHLIVTGHPPRKANEHRVSIQLLIRKSDGFSWGGSKSETVDGFSILGPFAK